MRWMIFFFILALLGGIFFLEVSSLEEAFKVDALLLKTVIKTNGSFTGHVKIMNAQNFSKHFTLSLTGFGPLISLSEQNFDLQGGGERNIQVFFSHQQGYEEGVYVGSLEVSDGREKKLLPVILEIESQEILFDSDLNAFPLSSELNKRINFDLKIFDLGRIGTARVEVYYFVKDFSGRTLFSESEHVVVKDQVSVSKDLDLPEDISEGNYVIGVVLRYQNSVSTASSFFKIGGEQESPVFSSREIVWFVVLGILILILLAFIFYSIYSRDVLLEELTRLYKAELKNQERYLRRQERRNERALRTKQERVLNKEAFSRVRKRRRDALKKMHQQRMRKFKYLKKVHGREELLRQLRNWKEQGYDTEILEREFKAPTVQDIQRQLRKWKKRGYDTKVLEERMKGGEKV